MQKSTLAEHSQSSIKQFDSFEAAAKFQALTGRVAGAKRRTVVSPEGFKLALHEQREYVDVQTRLTRKITESQKRTRDRLALPV